MNTQHNLDFFQRAIFLVNDWSNPYAPVVEETTLESFLRQYCEGDPARAWYVKEVNDSKPVWHNDTDGLREERYINGSRERVDMPDEYVDVITYEVREGLHSNITRNRLVDTFDSKQAAEEYLLNGLYWNYCNLDNTGAPYSADTRELCEAEIAERSRIAADEASV